MASEQLRAGFPQVAGSGDDVAHAVRRIRPWQVVVVLIMLVLAAQFVTFLVTAGIGPGVHMGRGSR